MNSADDTALRSTLAALPASMAEDRGVLTCRLNIALWERDWQQASALIEQMNGGEDDGQFAGSTIPVNSRCTSR
ncbi:MAG: hypothetical protein WAK31_28440 [Chthoniobacterales bacterium]